MKVKCNCLDKLLRNIETIVHAEESELVNVELHFEDGNAVLIKRMDKKNDC